MLLQKFNNIFFSNKDGETKKKKKFTRSSLKVIINYNCLFNIIMFYSEY
jgi:hypothetical protein